MWAGGSVVLRDGSLGVCLFGCRVKVYFFYFLCKVRV